MTNSYPKVGIGIITCQNREIHPNILNKISGPTSYYVYTDYERKGVPYGRNECIKHLYDAGCDYIFLFDDDAYPIDPQWQRKLVDFHESTGFGLFSYPSNDSKLFKEVDGIGHYQWNFGPFMSISRKMIDAIGYFNNEYVAYGFEDIAYIFRARRSGLNGSGEYDLAPANIHSIIFAEDVLGAISPDINTSKEDKDAGIEKNRPIFDKEVSSSKNYYPYKD